MTYIYHFNIKVSTCKHLQHSVPVSIWLLKGDASIKWCTGWNNLACTLQSSRKQLCARGHSVWALPHREQAFNGFLTLVITEEDYGHCGLKTNWPDETSSNNVGHPLYHGTHKHALPLDPLTSISLRSWITTTKAAPFWMAAEHTTTDYN